MKTRINYKNIMSKIIEKHVLKQFQVKKQIGSGSYGFVWQVISKKDNNKYALKKVYDAFRNDVDAQRTYRQIQILLNLNCPQIIKLEKIIKSKGNNDIYLVFQLMESDLLTINNLQCLKSQHIKFIFYQILLGINYLHQCGLIHRDLKPANILINSSSQIKICDFGLSRSHNNQLQKVEGHILTEQVATKWYRAPQLLLGSQNYGKQIDIWGFGCIMAEIILKRPIFNGLTTDQLFQQMVSLDREFQQQDLKSLKIKKIDQITCLSSGKKKSLQKILGKQNSQFSQLISKCLKINPNKRITIKAALQSSLFDSVKHLNNLSSINPQKFAFSLDDNKRFDVDIYRTKIYQLIQHFDAIEDATFQKNNLPKIVFNEMQSTKKSKSLLKQNQKLQTVSLHRNKKKHSKNMSCICEQKNKHQQQKMKKDSVHNSQTNKVSIFQSNSIELNKIVLKIPFQKTTLFGQKDVNSPYIKKQRIIKKPLSNLEQISLQRAKQINYFQKQNSFLNKFSKNGRQQLLTENSENSRQILEERKLIEKYSTHITSSIYSMKKSFNLKKNHYKNFFQ